MTRDSPYRNLPHQDLAMAGSTTAAEPTAERIQKILVQPLEQSSIFLASRLDWIRPESQPKRSPPPSLGRLVVGEP